ncbi:CDP-diacylglycerol diphosphatase [Erwinia tracheiphila]|uniref:CDP-diacylglycerol pyrophosphatase n=1 Tax=Erwinia tracheiphila TaxID=65700 RepID=A0A0M2KHX8_9GAMM|nr:CDP-diacylglycerol diphosphatase [Erwinia tracheiphila]EOS94643.1 CDP-diacylglycerol pyrophosphatase [Erwinia tracheiphila PSU-1]KKF36922.1 CDP-diacylglycerol pyrophosphatase [Erwinia tracheiphila]UIA88264.1 CDP-diacylglycerol diphosphatase [Erwinia tracheiphila]UIA96315.1 CDP-diacylglycerol diphosphatase [Erwinia tracheiphila]
MQGQRHTLIAVALVGVVVTAGCASVVLGHKPSAGALWNIVSQKCVPNQQKNNNPTPCRIVDLRYDYVVLKDQIGPLQFLLIPVEKITGIEDQKLLHPATPNFFAEAWRSRHYMTEKRGQPINDSAVSLAVNSLRGRTQDQLHIHISCLRPDIRRHLDTLASTLNSKWQFAQLGEHQYQVRTLTGDEMQKSSPFIHVANELPGAREEMYKYGIAVASLPDGRRAIMVIKRNLLLLNRGSAEELQDHSCSILKS